MPRLAACLIAATFLAGCVPVPVPIPLPSGGGGGGPTAVTTLDSTGSADVNAYRREAGLAPLRRAPRLDAVARGHAADMARNGFFGHTGSNGSSNGARIRAAGFQPCGAAENIAEGPFTVPGVLASWMGSAGHRRNMLNPRYTDYGLAEVGGKWVMTFAGRC